MKIFIILFILVSLLPPLMLLGAYLWLRGSSWTVDFWFKGMRVFIDAEQVANGDKWSHFAVTRACLIKP